jgi:hypothetical protein
MRPDHKFERVRHLLAKTVDGDIDCLKLWYEDRIGFGDTPSDYDMIDGDSIMMREQRGGKPVIYLYSPAQTDVSVALTLTSDWSFSAIYPVVPTNLCHHQLAIVRRGPANPVEHPHASRWKSHRIEDRARRRVPFWEAQ